jgi:acetyl-CoA carboxylase biotin carboxyl carrier protein
MTEQQIERVRQLSQWLAGTDITCFELSGPGHRIRLSRNGGTNGNGQGAVRQQADTDLAPPAHGQSEPCARTVIRAGSVGVFLQSHPLRDEPLAGAGRQVAAGQAVGLLKIGLVLLPVPAPRAGTVVRVAASHASAVGYGDPLIEIE